MIIEHNSHQDHSTDFYDFSQSLGCYAIVRFKVRSFAFGQSASQEFSIENLQQIFHNPSEPTCTGPCPRAWGRQNCIWGILEKLDTEEAINDSIADICSYISIDRFAQIGEEAEFESYIYASDDVSKQRTDWFFC